MLDLTRYIRPGDGAWWGQGGAEPEPLVNALLDQGVGRPVRDRRGPARRRGDHGAARPQVPA